MKTKRVDLKKIADTLQERCPFIVFAMLTGLDDEGRLKWLEHPELSVYIGSDTGNWYALEQILPVITETVPQAFCDVTLLNRVDVATRYRAAHGLCLFIRKGQEQKFYQFKHHASLDYRILRAQQRRSGTLEND
jgi:hypothetical protein